MSLTLTIEQDQDSENPRTAYDNLGTMVCFHGRYNLGDKHDFDSPADFEARRKQSDVVLCLPLYLYDHSGITIATKPFSCPWDSGQVGYIYITREQVCKEYGCKRIGKKVLEKVAKVLQSEVETYDLYLRGEVYGYVIKDEQDGVIDSCWGFYGEDYCREQGEEALKVLERRAA